MTMQPPSGEPTQRQPSSQGPGWPPQPSWWGPPPGGPPGSQETGPRRSAWRDWRIVLMSMAVVVLAAAGVLVYVRTASPSTPPRARLESALHATDAAVTADLAMDVKASFDGFSLKMTGTGSVNFADHSASLTMNVVGHSLSVIESGGVLYAKVGTLLGNQFPGKTWVRMPMSAFSSAKNNQYFVTSDPAKTMGALLKLGATVTPIGTETIDGSQDQGYKISFTLADLEAHASELPPSARSLFATSKTMPKTASVLATMYVDPAGQLQSAHVGVNAQATGHPITMSMDLTMSHFGTATVPGAPPSTQTVTYRQLKGSLGSGTLPFTLPSGAQVT